MYDDYNYPIGADTPDAPWNQEEIPERVFNVEVNVVLKKTVSVSTNLYSRHFEDETKEYVISTEDVNWKCAYENSGHFSVPELLEELKSYVEADMQTCSPNTCKGAHLKRLLEACNGWEVDEESYSEV